MTDKLDLHKSEQYTLSIRLSTDGFSFSIYNPVNRDFFYNRTFPVNTQRSMAANVKAFLSATDEIKKTFKKTNIIIHSQRYTIVPLDMFDDESMECTFYQNLTEKKNETILCNILSNSNSVVIFSLDKLTHVYLSEYFHDVRFFSSISPQIEHITANSKLNDRKKLFININNGYIDVIASDRGKLLLANTFHAQSYNDIIYFILNIWQQIGFDQEKDELHISGTEETCKVIIPELQKYIKYVLNTSLQSEFNRSTETNPGQIPFDVQSLILCE